jgi:hypothetical protein
MPPPRWPFSAREEVAAWVSAQLAALPVREGARLGAVWTLVERSAEAALDADPESVRKVVSALSPYAGGLVPDALLSRGLCAPPELAERLASVLRERLADLARDGSAREAGEMALALLAQSGGGEHAVVQRALARPESHEFDVVLEALMPGDARSPALRPLLARAYDRASTWPVRRRIAQLLGPGLGRERLQREPVELVRAAVRDPAAPPAAGHCEDVPN